jgi:hypothetical protein
MEQAQTLFREGVLAFRNENDIGKAQKLFMQSLKLNPQNEMGWVWLARTFSDQRRALDCVERALKINPQSEQALELKSELLARENGAVPPAAEPTRSTSTNPLIRTTSTMKVSRSVAAGAGGAAVGAAAVGGAAAGGKTDPRRTTQTNNTASQRKGPPTPDAKAQQRITALLEKAQVYAEDEDYEAAIEQWVRVLEIQADHDEAMKNAVRYLVKLNYIEDASELLSRAIDAGTTRPSIYLTAIDIANRLSDPARADDLRARMAELPGADEKVVVIAAEHYEKVGNMQRAIEVLENAQNNNPKGQKILLKLGELYHKIGDEAQSLQAYDRAARLGRGTAEGKAADKLLQTAVPVMTDDERGSAALAWREAAGVGVFYFLLAFQDAGLIIQRVGVMRWIGVTIALIGGFLLVTATSSPQQQPIARWLGGSVPTITKRKIDSRSEGVVEEPTRLPIIPMGMRVALGAVGSAILIGAFVLVFSATLNLFVRPVRADYMTFCEMIDLIVESTDEPRFYDVATECGG